jgi:anti-sigma regulatory factor (Ser/Thr protein kinase)
MCWRADARDAEDAQAVRRAIVAELSRTTKGDLFAAEIIVGELISNVARYTPGPFRAELDWGTERPTIVMHDHGDCEVSGDPREVDPYAVTGRGFALMRALGGSIEVRREPGRGSRVRVTLPLRRIAEAEPAHVRCFNRNPVVDD